MCRSSEGVKVTVRVCGSSEAVKVTGRVSNQGR